MATFGIPESIPNKYKGPSVNLVPLRSMPRRPLVTDKKYPVGQLVILSKDPATGSEGELWYLSNFNGAGQAIWIQLYPGAVGTVIGALTDDGAPAVVPDGSGLITFAGGTGITTSGQSPSNTVTITLDTASSAETIAGAINNKAVVPSGLEAKIGTQTQYGVGYGGGAGTAINWTAAGATNSVFVGVTAGAPVFSTTSDSYFDSIRFNNVNPGTLDHFEDVTLFTPAIQGSGAAGAGTYTEQHGAYWRLGKLVHVEINITWTAHTGTGDMLVSGFPYSFGAATSFYPLGTLVQNITLPANTLWVAVDGVNNQTHAELSAVRDADVITQVQMSNAGSVYCMGTYLLP